MLKFFEIGRRSSSDGFSKLLENDPSLIYQQQIKEHQEVALPLVVKVIDQKLVLQGYTLDSGHCVALAASIKQT